MTTNATPSVGPTALGSLTTTGSIPSPRTPPETHVALGRLLDDGAITHPKLSEVLHLLDLATFGDRSGLAELTDRAERTATTHGWIDLIWYSQLIRAELSRRQGDLTAAASLARPVSNWAIQAGQPLVRARSHQVLSVIHRVIGDEGGCLTQAILCLQHLPPEAPSWMRAVHVTTLGTALLITRSVPEGQAYMRQALDLAEAAGRPDLHMMVLNNLAFGLYLAGEQAEALAATEDMLTLHRRCGGTLFAHYRDTLARVRMLSGDLVGAEEALIDVVTDPYGICVNEADGLAACLVTLAEIQRLTERVPQAQATLDWCRALADARGLVTCSTSVTREQARLFASQGEYRQAYEELCRYLEAFERLVGSQRTVRAQVVHALYQVEQTAQELDQFRELAWRDPLTGLHNRRRVDEELPVLVARAAQQDRPFSVALFDLDHFKQVNDRWSHQVGDAVLQRIAGLATAAVPEGATVARIGGEEFLVLLPDTDLDAAREVAERLHARVREHHWGDLVGRTPITISVGLASCDGSSRPAAVIARADGHLYAAKRSGRDRVVG